jgi:hypothetical protein
MIKLISLKNKQLRMKYDRRHQTETMHSFWQYVSGFYGLTKDKKASEIRFVP